MQKKTMQEIIVIKDLMTSQILNQFYMLHGMSFKIWLYLTQIKRKPF